MYERGRSARTVITTLLGIVVVTSAATAAHVVYLATPNTIPSYCQEKGNWCGAATGQMILQGYPKKIEHPFSQSHVWNRIVAHRDDAGVNWATDPDGLRDTLQELGGDPGVHWVIFKNANAASLVHSVAFWMTRQRFPTAVLVFGFQHWVMIDGFTTDLDPTTHANVKLQFIEIVDPWNPPCPAATHGGLRILMSGSNWFSNYWYAPGNIPASKWNANFIAVIEPPKGGGMAQAPRQVETGKVISEEEAVQHAVKWIKELPIEEKRELAILRQTKPLKPLLVNQEKKGYYLVPFGSKEGEPVVGAVLVNAYNGDFQEVGVFGKPTRQIAREAAHKIALDHLKVRESEKRRAQAQLIFQPSEQTESRFMPVWRVTVEKRSAYVTQEGRVFDKLTAPPLGD